MKILLDTHIFLWALTDDKRLSNAARRMIVDRSNTIFVSAACAWEIAIKSALGKLSIDGDLAATIQQLGFEHLPITLAHALATRQLPPIHSDPFDRILVAQSQVEVMALLTGDKNILLYPANTIAN